MLTLLRPNRIPFRHYLQRAAVAVIYRYRNEACEILFIKRAIKEGDPWSGHMAFPGGVIQKEDSSASDAAIRETQEEIGIDLYRCSRFSKRLADLLTRRHHRLLPMVVSPFMFLLMEDVEFTRNEEVEEVVWIPLDFFKDESNKQSFYWQAGRIKLRMPCYDYEERRIWGLTYMMLQEIINKKF
ncbi:MAG: CoA pyrophosphatase [Pseudomonadales bacterium]|nr:CoA pyrophosphatase [Pseudomonadales bacterium]